MLGRITKALNTNIITNIHITILANNTHFYHRMSDENDTTNLINHHADKITHTDNQLNTNHPSEVKSIELIQIKHDD